MRRRRLRSYTIDAENEEDFKRKCDSALKNESFDVMTNNTQKIEELEEEYENDMNKNILVGKDDLVYEGFGDIDDEDDFGDEIDSEDIIDKLEENHVEQDEKNIELLCVYLKHSIAIQAKENSNVINENIFYRSKNPLHTLSGNAIYDLNVKELVDNIMAENELEENNENELENNKQNGKNNSLKEFICQNIKGDCTLKIMFMSNNDSTRNSFVQKFFMSNNNIENENDDLNMYNNNVDFEIRKKQIRLFNKNISLQIFDTSNEFHNNISSKIYYQFSNGFFIFIEATNHKVQKYLEDIFSKMEKYLSDKTVVIFGVNMLFEQDCCIDGFNLKEFCSNNNYLYIPIKLNDFIMKNNIILKILNLILIKKIDNKKDSIRKNSKEEKKLKNKINENIIHLTAKNENEKKYLYDITKMDIPNSLGYKKSYRLNHINAFDTETQNPFLRRKNRKWSFH